MKQADKSDKFVRAMELVRRGEKIYRACNHVGLSLRDWYDLSSGRAAENAARRLESLKRKRRSLLNKAETIDQQIRSIDQKIQELVQ